MVLGMFYFYLHAYLCKVILPLQLGTNSKVRRGQCYAGPPYMYICTVFILFLFFLLLVDKVLMIVVCIIYYEVNFIVEITIVVMFTLSDNLLSLSSHCLHLLKVHYVIGMLTGSAQYANLFMFTVIRNYSCLSYFAII